ncbi:MAG: dehydrogenase/reductase SDR family protein 12 [Arenicella sp.]|jgi:dehydrogenase/reductase SDR family protein 12
MSHTIEIKEQFHSRRSAEDVFEYITDFSRITEWDHSIISSKKITDGAISNGSQFDLMFAMGPRKSQIVYEITEFHYPSRAVLRGTSDNFVAVDTLSIEDKENGCDVTWQTQINFTGSSAKIVKLLERRIKAGAIKTIRDLAIALDDNFDAPVSSSLRTLADKAILPGVLSFTKYGFEQAKKKWHPVTASIKAKHVLITGATSGLGLATATQLAHLGAYLTLVARNQKKANEVAKKITKLTGNHNIKIEVADLSEIKQVSDLADRLLKKGQRIDILINNAGALLNPRQESNDGLEKSFVLLLLGPFLMTEKILPLLAKSRAARIINVSSGGMYTKRISLSNLQNTKGKYSGSEAYARAKRGLVIIGEQWAERWAKHGITVHNMHPGWALTPGVQTSIPEFARRTKPFLRTPEQGADTIIWLATASEVAKTSGLFWLDRFPHSTHLTNKTKEKPEHRLELRKALKSFTRTFTD